MNARKVKRRQGSRLYHLRNAILIAHGMCTGRYVQSDSEMRKRAGRVLAAAIMNDPVMAGFLGYPSIETRRDVLTGSGDLDGLPADRRIGGERRSEGARALDCPLHGRAGI
jgi:hypothetical protein